MPPVLNGLLLLVGAFTVWTLFTNPIYAPSAGYDFGIYREAAARHWSRPLAIGLTLGLSIVLAFEWSIVLTTPAFQPYGHDRTLYEGATLRWLAGGPF